MTRRLDLHGLAPEVSAGFQRAEAAIRRGPLPPTTKALVKLRASQINGCGFCVDMHANEALAEGESTERLFAVAAWRETPYFTAAERAALALAEAGSALADQADPVPDDLWDEVCAHFDEAQRAHLIATVALINAWNRISVLSRTPAGTAIAGR